MSIPKAALDDLQKRREAAKAGGGSDKLEARRAKGVMTARDRLENLFQAGTFQEWGLHANHDCHHFGMEEKSLPGDGVVTGTGMVDGRLVAAFSQDFTVSGGSLGRIHAKKICDLMDYALKVGCPVLGFNDSGGARIQEGDNSLSGYGQVFFRNVLVSGVVPQIAIVAGPCAGGAAYSPALMDFIIMVKGSSNMFICGPDVIKAVTGQQCTMDEIGSPLTNASVSGNVQFVAENDQHAIDIARKLLSFMPANNLLDPPHRPVQQLDLSHDSEIGNLVPESAKDPLDVKKIIARLVDNADFLEVYEMWAQNIVVGFARMQGIVCGIIANNPAVKAGTLDIDSSFSHGPLPKSPSWVRKVQLRFYINAKSPPRRIQKPKKKNSLPNIAKNSVCLTKRRGEG
ncbi:MAG: Methylmalonyl-CoA carboxyltransferase subunit [Verrucomicrobiales bacterium]|nr:Methylmalonyl-CoA carboxyltransferase subunit [Verrucomicrobiales bacterium]